MASEILGLFGGKSSQQLRGDALDSLLVSPSQMGSQSLLQQVVSMGRNAGAVAGMGAGQLLGGKVAGEVEASYIDQAVQEASKDPKLTPVERMEKVAAFLADKPGMGSQYMKAMEEAQRLKVQKLQMDEATFKANNRTQTVNVKVKTPVVDALGRPIPGQFTEKSIPLTQVYDNEKQEWVWVDPPPAGAVMESTGAAVDAPAADANSPQAALARKLAAAKAKMGVGTPNQSDAEANRLLQKPVPPKPAPYVAPQVPRERGGYDPQGGLIMPEGY